MKASLAFLPPPLRNRCASGSVVLACVSLRRRSLLGPEALEAGGLLNQSPVHTTSSNRARPTSWSISRGRFLVKTVASKLRSISSMSRNQR